MSEKRMPAVSLAAAAGRRLATLELAREIEKQGFAGIYCPSFGDGVGLCEALALATETISFGTSIANIYTRHVSEFAHTASFIHEVSGGRFRFGVGVSHAPVHERLGVKVGKPLGDMRRFVDELRGLPRVGELPPLVLAAMRDKMVRLAGEISDGVVFANACRSHMAHSLEVLGESKASAPDFFIGNMIPTCIADDEKAAAARNRKTLIGYTMLPNYRNYWKAVGYREEMEAVERVLAVGEQERIPEVLSDRWLADCTLYGSVAKVREGVEAWFEAGVRTPILVPSSTRGGQMEAFQELLAAFR